MAETRTFDPSEPEGIQKLVREALGESIRPVEPGGRQKGVGEDDRMATTISAADLPASYGPNIIWADDGE
ncbi:MAG: hypothetical protein IPJ61_12355 [Tessaracoccus sp.]|uniref:hypothetical protein n=1 Tax=Tessaracoccus sp. TaxID=1971211 RepID=UPI001ECAAD70|nr:hypothetical protein [Tessaracoccus sp.]MBK7821834.1 hypothetical protein [Tessaracoccus sp.]